MEIRLSERLFRVASFVQRGSVPVDVGTDHAYVPIFLLQTGVCEKAFATDIRPGPLKNAGSYAKKFDIADRLTLFLCDGLALCDPECLDTVIIAGMGGETMIHILENSPWALEKHLVLQPQSKCAQLRRYLASHGLAILDAHLAKDAGKLYEIWNAGPGPMDAEALVEPKLIEHRDPLLQAYLTEQRCRREKQLRGLKASRRPDGAVIDRLEQELRALERISRAVPD